MPINIFKAIEDDSISAEEFNRYLDLKYWIESEISPLNFAVSFCFTKDAKASEVLFCKIKMLVERSYIDKSLNIDPFEFYDEDLNLIEASIVCREDKAAAAIFSALSEEDKKRVFAPGASYNVSAVENAAMNDMDEFLFCMIRDQASLNLFKQAIKVCNALSLMYGSFEGGSEMGNTEVLLSHLLASEALQKPHYRHFKDAASALSSSYSFDLNAPLQYYFFGSAAFAIILPDSSDHEAFFIIDCDQNKVPKKISYCDAWRGIFGVNQDKYSFGETTFVIDSSKVQTAEQVAAIIKEWFVDKPYPNQKEAKKALRPIAQCDDRGDPIITEKHIPTKTQSRLNCFSKSTFILMRALARRMDHTLDDDLQWTPELEKDGFPDFNASNLGGKGRELYKELKNDLIDEAIVFLHRNIKNIPNMCSLIIVKRQLDKALLKTIKKQEGLRSEAETEGYGSHKELAEIYGRRREILEDCMPSIAARKEQLERPKKTMESDGAKALASSSQDRAPK